MSIAVLQVPGAIKAHRYNRRIDEPMRVRQTSNLADLDGPGKMIAFKALQHRERR